MFSSSVLLALAATLPSALAAPCVPAAANGTNIKCPIIFDGRVLASKVPTDFDSYATSPFDAVYVKGNNLNWSQILQFPTETPSRFENSTYKAVEVTISDASIFQTQNGFRRAGLIFQGDSNTASPGYVGSKTLHFSVRQDPARPLNLTHEYLNVWHESSDYSADQIQFEIGTIIGQEGLPKQNFKVFDRNLKELWTVPMITTDWQNFAFTLNVAANTVQIYYSTGSNPLASVAGPLSVDLSGGGQYQIGMIKKPTGTTDVVNAGYQEPNLNEGQIYGSLFVEDSTNGCVSL